VEDLEADEGTVDAVEPETAEGSDDAGPVEMPLTAASMPDDQLKALLEALIFASDRPLTIQRMRQLTRVSGLDRLGDLLDQIAADYEGRGICLQQVSGGYQFRTRTTFSTWVQQLIAGRPVRLSRAQLETLSIIAYRQPITRPAIDDIRGVDSGATLRLLLERGLIRILGKKEEPGRPLLYGTTKEFLDFFSLADLRELPTLREYSELTDESRDVVRRLDEESADESIDAIADSADAADEPLAAEPPAPEAAPPETAAEPEPEPDVPDWS
jgi:segregation and condensation protein B